ncbi:MAG TPA: disulfide bond formation protein B [Steroidobacteraceae bacterium]
MTTRSPIIAATYAWQLLILVAFAGVLTAALVMQFVFGELPCPLCLLQRVAMFGICFGIMLDFRDRFSWRNVGLSLLCALFLLVVSVRQTLLDIYPRPGHSYVGSAILGIHMPVWSIIITVLFLFAYGFQLVFAGGEEDFSLTSAAYYPRLKRAGQLASLYVIALLLVNVLAVAVQCGVGQCHTMDYALL